MVTTSRCIRSTYRIGNSGESRICLHAFLQNFFGSECPYAPTCCEEENQDSREEKSCHMFTDAYALMILFFCSFSEPT